MMYFKDLLYSVIFGYLIVLIVLLASPSFGQGQFGVAYPDPDYPYYEYVDAVSDERMRYGIQLGDYQDTWYDDGVVETLSPNNYRRAGKGKVEHVFTIYMSTSPYVNLVINTWADVEGVYTFYLSFDNENFTEMFTVDHTYDGVYYIENIPDYFDNGQKGIVYIKVIGQMPLQEGVYRYDRRGKPSRTKGEVFEDYSLYIDEIISQRFEPNYPPN